MKQVLFLLAIQVLSSPLLSAQEKTFIKEYTYKAGEMDSKISCRAIAINELRSMLLNEIGVYVESEQLLTTADVGGTFSQDFVESIATISAGVTRLEILEEKWTGDFFWMKAAITIDKKSLELSLERLINDRQKVKELEILKHQLNEANKDLAALNLKLNRSKSENDRLSITAKYNTKLNAIDSFNLILNHLMLTLKPLRESCALITKGFEFFHSKDYKQAIVYFDRGMEINAWPDIYFVRGVAKTYLGDNTGALSDLNKFIDTKPDFTEAYFVRGRNKNSLGDVTGAIIDYNKVIELSPKHSDAYIQLGNIKAVDHDHEKAIMFYDKAVEANPNYPTTYYWRGSSRFTLQDFSGAIRDFTKLIELEPDVNHIPALPPNVFSPYYLRGQSKKC